MLNPYTDAVPATAIPGSCILPAGAQYGLHSMRLLYCSESTRVYFVIDFSGTPQPFKAIGELSFTIVEAESF